MKTTVKKPSKKPRSIFIFIFAVLFLIFCYNAWKAYSKRFSPAREKGSAMVQRVLNGEYACLPNKITDGPVTLECALGLRSDDGFYYALDMTDQDPTMRSVLKVGQKMEVDGALLVITDPDSWALKKYDIKGVMKVEKIKLHRD